jgi:hypothetical protein
MIQYNRSTQFQMIRQSSIRSIPGFFFLQINEVPWCNWGPGSCVQVHWLFSSSNRSGRRKSARFLGHPSKTFFHLLSRWLSHNIRHIRTISIIFASTVVLNLPLLNLISINLLPMFRNFTSNSLYLMIINYDYYCTYICCPIVYRRGELAASTPGPQRPRSSQARCARPRRWSALRRWENPWVFLTGKSTIINEVNGLMFNSYVKNMFNYQRHPEAIYLIWWIIDVFLISIDLSWLINIYWWGKVANHISDHPQSSKIPKFPKVSAVSVNWVANLWFQEITVMSDFFMFGVHVVEISVLMLNIKMKAT